MRSKRANDPIHRLTVGLRAIARKKAHTAEAILVAIATAIAGAPAMAAENCENEFKLFPHQWPLGYVKHYTAEERVARAFDDLGLSWRWGFYTNKYPYVVLESDDIFLRLRRLDKRSDNPGTKANVQLKRHVPNQILLIPELAGTLPEQLQTWVVFGYDPKNKSKVRFIEVRFADSDGLILTDTLELLELVKEPQAPQQEPDADATRTPLRHRQKGQQVG